MSRSGYGLWQSHPRVIDVIVVFDPDARADAETDWPNQKIIGNPLDILMAGFAGRFTSQRWTDRILRPRPSPETPTESKPKSITHLDDQQRHK